jgi:hypothetical protein
MPLRFVLDEDTRDTDLWHAICTHNQTVPTEAVDVVRVGDGGPDTGTKDESLIEWAMRENRIVVSHDRNTLIGTHDKMVANGRTTPGVWIIRRQSSIPSLVEFLVFAGVCCDATEFASRVEFIPLQE